MWDAKFKPYLKDILKYTSVKDVFLNVFNPDKPNRYHAPLHHDDRVAPPVNEADNGV